MILMVVIAFVLKDLPLFWMRRKIPEYPPLRLFIMARCGNALRPKEIQKVHGALIPQELNAISNYAP
jgi:hypothetical protein